MSANKSGDLRSTTGSFDEPANTATGVIEEMITKCVEGNDNISTMPRLM